MGNGTYTGPQLLADLGITVRTWRHWVRLKLVPKPLGRGRGARYDARHVVRGRAVKALRSQGASLRNIRGQIAAMTDEQLAALVPPPRAVTAEGVPLPPPEPTYPYDTWEQVALMPGLALMVNPGRGAVVRRIADEIWKHYGVRALV